MERLDQWDGVIFLTKQQLGEVDALLGPGRQPARHPARPFRAQGAADPQAREATRRDAHQPEQAQADLPRDQGHDPRRAAGAPARHPRRVGSGAVPGTPPGRHRQERCARRARAATPTTPGRSSTRRPSHCSPAATRRSVSCWSRAWATAASRSATTCRTGRRRSSPTGSTASWCRRTTSPALPPRSGASPATTAELAPIREAAYRRALEFNDESVTAKWAAVMEEALASKRHA